jgi:hypothetical protein
MGIMDFYGSELTDDECDAAAVAWISHVHFEDEAKAMHNKWFDYRLWPHLKASYYFAECYKRAYQNFFAETRDKETSKIIPVFHHHDPMQSRQKTNIHLARQAFDIVGVRYEFGIRFAMKRFCERGWKSMPRTNQLYGDEIITDMKEAWDAECRAKLQIADNPYFLAENYCGDIIQNQYHDWLEGQVNKRVHKYMTVGQLVYINKVMPEEVAITRFGSELVARGKKDAL